MALPALLSFLWPGLGQLRQGHRTRAVVFALPILALVPLLLLLVKDGFETAALRLLDPSIALGVLVLAIVAGLWRLASMGEVVMSAGGPGRVRRVDLAFVIALAALVGETHALVGSYALSFYDAGTAIFEPLPTPGPGASPLPGASFDPGPSPFETPATAQSRINVLLIGIDSSEHRTQSLTDTMIVASVDPVTHATSMVSFPRDISRFPMYDGRTYNSKINSFMNWAAGHPQQFQEGGVGALMREVGYLLGVPIHYYASINLDGFVELVDAMDHVTIDNPRDISDPVYGGWTDGRPIGFHLSAGVHDLDGQSALAYARSRKGFGDSDFTRAARQQQLLSAVRKRLADPSLLPRLPAILRAASAVLRTNFPSDRLDEMLILARQVDDASTNRVVLGPPFSFHPPTNTTGGTYILQLRMKRLEELSIQLFGEDSAYWSATGGASPAPSGAP